MLSNSYRQFVTYWAPLGPDGNGGTSWALPKRMYGRWETRSEEVHNSTGELVVSRSVIFLPEDIEVHGYLYEGESVAADPTTVDNAQRIVAFVKTPNLRNMKTERRAYCK